MSGGRGAILAPVPGSALAAQVDARRRAGLADPDWTLSLGERAHMSALLSAASKVLDELTMSQIQARSPRITRHHDLLAQAGIDPYDQTTLLEMRGRLSRTLLGEQSRARLDDMLSVIDPESGRVSSARFVTPIGLMGFVGLVALLVSPPLFALGAVLGLLVLTVGCTCRTALSPDRLLLDQLDPSSSRSEVVAVQEGESSFDVACALTSDAKTVESSPVASAGDVADVWAERDRIVAELHALDSRLARLDAIADDTDEANRADHVRLVDEAQRARRILCRDAVAIVAQASHARQTLADAEQRHRRRQARETLDELAAPPPSVVTDDLWPGWDDRWQPGGLDPK